MLQHVGVWDRRPRGPAVPLRGERQRESHRSSAESFQVFVFPSSLLPSLLTRCLPSPLSPIPALPSSHRLVLPWPPLLPSPISFLFPTSCRLPRATRGATRGAEPPHGHNVGRSEKLPRVPSPQDPPGCLYLSSQPQGWLLPHQSRPSSARGASPRRPGSPSAPSSAPASRSLCGWLMMKTTGHMKAAPLTRVRGLQATWEVADSRARLGRSRQAANEVTRIAEPARCCQASGSRWLRGTPVPSSELPERSRERRCESRAKPLELPAPQMLCTCS